MGYNSKYKGAEVDALLGKANTAVQPEDLAEVATSGSYDDLSNKPAIPDVSNKVDKESGKGLSTNDYTTTEKNKLAGIASGAEVNVQSDWNETNTSSDAYIKNKPTIPAEQVNADWNATSGKAQILNKPTIPAAVTESTVSGWGFTKNAGTVTGVKINGSTKSPSSGTVDLGNVATSIKINGSTKNPANGVVDLGTVITSHQDISGKQDELVSGTNIKTINGQSILGSGDIAISGGGAEEQIAEPLIEDMGDGLVCAVFDKGEYEYGSYDDPMLPNVTYICPVPVSCVVVEALQPPTGAIGKYTLHFSTSNATNNIILIAGHILMANGDIPYGLELNTTYELSIVATKIGNVYVYKGVLTSFS